MSRRTTFQAPRANMSVTEDNLCQLSDREDNEDGVEDKEGEEVVEEDE